MTERLTDTQAATMTRCGPVPGTTGRTPAAVARVALEAHTLGRNMATEVAAHYDCTTAAAKAAIARARKAGHPIPYDWGFRVAGEWQQHGGPAADRKPAIDRANAIRYAHGTDSAYRDGCKCRKCRHAHALAAQRYRAKMRAKQTAAKADRRATNVVQEPRARAARPFRPPVAIPGHTHVCATCGHQAATRWELAGHTLDHHGRPLVTAERTPQQVAA